MAGWVEAVGSSVKQFQPGGMRYSEGIGLGSAEDVRVLKLIYVCVGLSH